MARISLYLVCILMMILSSHSSAQEITLSDGILRKVEEWSISREVGITGSALEEIVSEITSETVALLQNNEYASREVLNVLDISIEEYLDHLLKDGEGPKFGSILIEKMSPGGSFFNWPTRWPKLLIDTNIAKPEIVIDGEKTELTEEKLKARPMVILISVGKRGVSVKLNGQTICSKDLLVQQGGEYSIECRI